MEADGEVSPPGKGQNAVPPSTESVRSKTPPPEFSEEPRSANTRSKTPPPEFSEEPRSATTSSLLFSLQETPPAPDCVSLRSKNPPLEFSIDPGPAPVKRSGSSDSEDFSLLDRAPGLELDPFTAAQREHKESLKSRCDIVTEGIEGAGETVSLNRIYTELFITEKQREEDQHEVQRLQAGFKNVVQETSIRCHDIFKPLPCDQRPVRTVLTSGVAGVGKTFSVLKFCLDWAQGSENQELELVVPLSFRELNLATGQVPVASGQVPVVPADCSLLELMHMFHPALQPLTAQSLTHRKLLFIFDGLDENRLPLDFTCEFIHEVTQTSEVSKLLINLFRGKLLPDALIWTTTRPAAANQVPASCVHRLTEVRGFTDTQKEEFFTKRFTDPQRCSTVLRHLRASQSLHTMCQIPVFCWITSTVLDHMLESDESGPLPQTLTDMYARFLLVQTYRKRKYRPEGGAMEVTQSDCDLLLKLGRLAFEHLQSGNIMFYQKDLQQVGLDLSEAALYSGLCTKILKEESVIFRQSVYCFIHLSVQEFLAAVYMLRCFNHNQTEQVKEFLSDWEENLPLDIFLKMSLEKSFENQSGRLDLFVRFLHGLSKESNQALLRSLLGPVRTDAETTQEIVRNLKERNTGRISANGSITVFSCLTEMNDRSVHGQILDVLKAEFGSEEEKLAEFHCGSLAQKLQMPQEVLDELDIKRFRRMPDGKLKLVPPNTCREATILWNGLSKEHAEVVASALKSSSSQLRLLDLWLRDGDAVEAFCDGLRDPHCRLDTLSLHHSRLSKSSCCSLASALKSNPSHLRKLDVSWNEELQDPGVEQLCAFLQSPECLLDILRLENCRLGKGSCSSLASALTMNPCHLRELDVTENELTDAGVQYFCDALQTPHLKLEHLRLDNCSLSEASCSSLASALILNPSSNLKKLDFSVNEVCDSGVELLSEYLRSPNCRLEAIELKACGLTDRSCAVLASSLNVFMKDLRLNWNENMKDSGVEHMSGFVRSPHCGLEVLRFRGCGVSGTGCSSLASALESTPSSPLRELDLCENSLSPGDVETLSKLLLNPQYKLEKLEWEEN
uniref:NACHT domain-containing protein n=1 Tax=Neogobius melanostomus TaxID=47308 RepID=A0A8C6TET0_9GOBI